MIHVIPSTKDCSNQFVSTQNDLTFSGFIRACMRRLFRPSSTAKPKWNGLLMPECHPEFVNNFSRQIDLYRLESFVFPMLEAGFRIEKILSTREENHVIVASK